MGVFWNDYPPERHARNRAARIRILPSYRQCGQGCPDIFPGMARFCPDGQRVALSRDGFILDILTVPSVGWTAVSEGGGIAPGEPFHRFNPWNDILALRSIGLGQDDPGRILD